jgi:hypothetical protein
MKNPAQRLGSNGSVDTVRQHPFFEGIDWQALQEKRVKPPEKEKVATVSTVCGFEVTYLVVLIIYMEIFKMPPKLEFNLL